MSEAVKQKLSWWQRLILAALATSGAALVAAGKGLMTYGDERGAMRVTIEVMRQQIESNHQEIVQLRSLVFRMSRRDEP